MGFLRFQGVWEANLLIRIHFGCILTRFGTQNVLKSVSKFRKKNENSNVWLEGNDYKAKWEAEQNDSASTKEGAVFLRR